MNKVFLVGFLGDNPELKKLESGNTTCNFSIATNEKWVDKSGQKKESTEWHRVVAWGNQAELCSQYLKKGSHVMVEGKIRTREWDDKKTGTKKHVTEVQLQNVQFLDGSPKSKQKQEDDFERPDAVMPKATPTHVLTQSDFLDDVPF